MGFLSNENRCKGTVYQTHFTSQNEWARLARLQEIKIFDNFLQQLKQKKYPNKPNDTRIVAVIKCNVPKTLPLSPLLSTVHE